MPIQGRLVDEAYPALPFYVNDHGQDSLFSITVASGSGVVSGGTVLAKRASDSLYVPYDDGGSGGAETAVGILMNRIDATDGHAQGSMMVHGVVRSGSLYGVDAAAITDLTDAFIFV